MGILRTLFEERAHPSNPTNWLLYGLSGGIRSHAGVDVSEESALSATAVFAAVRGLAETIASLPLHLYRRKNPRGKERAIDHPLYSILHIKPNPEMTSMAYRETIAGHAIMWGTSYSEIEKNEAGRIKALWPLLPGNMLPKRINSELVYVYKLPDGGTKIFAAENILRITGFSKNGIVGYEPIKKGREAIGLSLALEEFGARFFGNGAHPHTVLEHPEQLSPEAHDRLKKAWEERQQGLSNAHRTAILEEGMKLKEYGISPEDAQALESRKFQVTEIARIFNMPPHMLKDLERASFNNIEMMSIEFVIYTIRPWLVRFEQAYSTQLLKESELKEYFFEHLVDGLLRGDIKSRYEAYAPGRQWGFLSANDIREMENKNPIEGGDIYLVPLNMIPADQAGQPVEPPPAKSNEGREARELRKGPPLGRDRIQASYHRLFVDAGQRVVNREGLAIKRAVKKYLGQRNLQSLNDWLEKFYADMPDNIRKVFMPVISSYAEAIAGEAQREIGVDVGMTPELKQFVEEYMDTYSARHIESSLEQLRALIKDGEAGDMAALQETIKQRVDEWQEKRPEKIANRETSQLSNAVALGVFWGAGLQGIWRIRGKTCPYCRALEGRKVNQGQYFVGPGDWKPEGVDTPMFIRGIKKHPPLHRGCDCYISAW